MKLETRGFTPPTRRAGFTLIELLVVIAIIGILAALAAGAAVRLIAVQQKNNTNTLVQKVNGSLQRSWNASLDDIKYEITMGQVPTVVVTLAGGDLPRANVIWRKLRLKKEFPQSFQEALSPTAGTNLNIPGMGPRPEYVAALKNAGITSGSNPPANYESSVCLLMSLSIARRGVVLSPTDLGTDAVKPVTGATSLQQIQDAYKTPIGFWRWPYGNPDMNGLVPGVKAAQIDPQDPEGTLLNPGWNNPNNVQNITIFETLCHPIHSGSGASWKPVANYLIPVVGSAGPNMQLGLDPYSMAVTNTAQASDNIYSYNTQ